MSKVAPDFSSVTVVGFDLAKLVFQMPRAMSSSTVRSSGARFCRFSKACRHAG